MSLIQLSSEDKTVVKRWWKDFYFDIRTHGYVLSAEFIPHTPTRPPPNQRSFNDIARNDIARSEILISAPARRETDAFGVMLTWVPPWFEPRPPEPRDHCAPCLDLFMLENGIAETHTIAVTPLLHPLDKRPFKTFPDFIDFFDEICEGIQFMHELNILNERVDVLQTEQRKIAYRACKTKNIMWTDPPLVHPDYGTVHPYRYYFFDFSFSRRHPTRDEVDGRPIGKDWFAPEHDSGDPCDPLETDIYNIGSLVREKFLDKFQGFDPMRGLVEEMTSPNPHGRPVIQEVVNRFDSIKQLLGADGLRLRPHAGWNWEGLRGLMRSRDGLTLWCQGSPNILSKVAYERLK